jgi:hypothetical protein
MNLMSNNVTKILFQMCLFFIFILVSRITIAQQLHHEMISTQSGSKLTESALLVSYSTVQQSVTGASSNGYIVQQGFQQSNCSRILEPNTILVVSIFFHFNLADKSNSGLGILYFIMLLYHEFPANFLSKF